MAQQGPKVSVAVICENVLRDHDDVISAIRIIDILSVDVPPEALGQPVAITVRLLVILKSVEFIGKCVVRLDLRAPDGTRVPGSNVDAAFLGENHGVTINVQAVIQIKDFGVYYFDVVCDDIVLTTVPFRIVQGSDLESEKQRYRSHQDAPRVD